MSHANAALTPRQRLRLARKVVDEEWAVAAAADYFRVSWPTADKWASRYLELGEAGMADRFPTSWFADHGVRIERVLSDNGSAYRSHAWKRACGDLDITPKFTRPRRPQSNGKIERFHGTLADGWAYAKHYNSESARRAALPAWLHFYNHHRPHTAIGKLPPISRISNNLAGHYT